MDTPNSTTTLKDCSLCGREWPNTDEYFPYRKPGILAARCRACARERTAQWRKDHPNAAKDWRDAHPDYQKKWYEENRETHLARTKERYDADPERKLELNRRWKEENPERRKLLYKAQRSRRRNRMMASEEQHTASDIALQYRSQRGRCWWCGKQVGDTYHVDHRIPLARGGSNGPGNICIACPHCNSQKKAKLPHEWIGRLL
jgi:5-methylcytosine-specific restriction endonuclease McrA